MRYEVGARAHMKKCTFCQVEPATGTIQKPLDDGSWYFNCDRCGNMIKIKQGLG